MKIINKFPPNYKLLKKAFKLHPGIIFTYGDTIYNPDNGIIPKHLEEHEAVHTRQQGEDIDGWWVKYIASEDFRLSQEIEAYQRQYRVAKNTLNRNELFNLLKTISLDLSSEMYGNIIPFNKAMEAIKSNKTYKFNI